MKKSLTSIHGVLQKKASRHAA